jgi:hypothetical protein
MSTSDSIILEDESDLAPEDDSNNSSGSTSLSLTTMSAISSPPPPATRRKSFDLNTMDPEDWLVKHLSSPGLATEKDDESTEESWSSVSTKNRPKESNYYAPPTIAFFNGDDAEVGLVRTRASSTSLHDDDDVEQGEDVVVPPGYDHETEEEQEEYVAHVEGRVVDDDESGVVLVVDGEVTQEEKNRKALIMVSFVVFVAIALIVLVVAFSTLAMNRNGRNPPESGRLQPTAMNTTNNSKAAGQNHTLKEPSMIATFVRNQTIADGFRANTSDPSRSLLIIPVGGYILDLLRRPGINMTVFGQTANGYYEMAKIPQLIAKVFQPSYSGHIVSSKSAHC